MKIKRITATKILTKAIDFQDRFLFAIMSTDEALTYCVDTEQLTDATRKQSDAIWIYNQSQETSDLMSRLIYNDGQKSIEVFQDTEGVLGLRGYQMKGKIQTPVTLELTELS